MRVLIVLTSNDRRGAEVEGSQLCARLSGEGVAGVEARVVALRGGSPNPLDVPALGSRPLSAKVLRELRARARWADVVVAFGSTALPACAMALAGTGKPFVYRSIGDPARWVRGRVHRWRTGLLFRRAARVVALWPAAADAIERLYGVPVERLSCIPNARPPAPSAVVAPATLAAPEPKAAARERFGVPTGARLVAWVGAFGPEKRPVAAVEAVAACDGAWLLMAGDGPLAGEVHAACERLLPGRHRLVGVVSPLEPVWAAADVVLLTSSTEGMPGVLLEAALCGVPAVAADVGAVGEIVIDGVTGRVLPPNAPAGRFAAALDEAVAASTEWGSAAANHAAAFTWPVVVPQWVALLAELQERVRKPGG